MAGAAVTTEKVVAVATGQAEVAKAAAVTTEKVAKAKAAAVATHTGVVTTQAVVAATEEVATEEVATEAASNSSYEEAYRMSVLNAIKRAARLAEQAPSLFPYSYVLGRAGEEGSQEGVPACTATEAAVPPKELESARGAGKQRGPVLATCKGTCWDPAAARTPSRAVESSQATAPAPGEGTAHAGVVPAGAGEEEEERAEEDDIDSRQIEPTEVPAELRRLLSTILRVASVPRQPEVGSKR